MKKCLNKIYWEGMWKEVKMMFFLLFLKVTKLETFQGPLNIRTFHWPLSKMFPQWPPSTKHSKGYQVWNLLVATKLGTLHWPPSWGLPLPPSLYLSLSFSLKAWIWIICLSFFGHDFQFEFLKTCSYNFPWEEKSSEF